MVAELGEVAHRVDEADGRLMTRRGQKSEDGLSKDYSAPSMERQTAADLGLHERSLSCVRLGDGAHKGWHGGENLTVRGAPVGTGAQQRARWPEEPYNERNYCMETGGCPKRLSDNHIQGGHSGE